ncbi:ATP-binding sensor histidine kinase [Calothrix sp. PCC 7507]|uniref:trifunctional serine/threonine-protein kinase/ATP-binding protein/sensor histidine kinase n=1 Tax=Calothrix sp. PCC 7507 TaxID=99598 RepID=UPI00029EE042|nr:ATP-binding sensor histidine kinase [Calothrix sp. PCC 7507]AFY35092.1 multi-sensor signal transduction multi-kinase [Calothrix sp. PCC 7507]
MTVLLDTTYTILGYRITEKIYSGSKTLVYRAIREEDQQSVILKLMRNEYPTFAEIAQFRNQYTITKNLDLPGIIKPHNLENYQNGYALVMEDFGGISLADWQLEKKPVSLSEFFAIAIQIVSILERLHRDRVIHKDIKPANILIQPTTGEIKIIDFSIASLLPREIQFLTNPNVLEGTLAYISPEQTGRMNRGIDYRTDFYSLGVTFFELLTGQVPFSADDPMELVHCHIAKEPPQASSINTNIPSILSDIISKLMAKNAEDRYQSSYGLKYDLELCYDQWQNTGTATFELAVQDISDSFLIPEKLYGRQRELETLLAAFKRVTEGTTEMILVSGFSGIGKTAVINEVHKPIARQRSYFIKGKFDQFQRDIPLSGLVQAFRDLIGQLLSETDAQVQQWKARILSALGTQSQVITDVIPELELIVGKQPEITELSGSAAQNRFNLLFQRFIQVFTTKEHPLVIFLDDLQWADVTSLKFMQLLMCENTSSPFAGELQKLGKPPGGLLLIGAYRDNEVSPVHPLSLTLKEIKETGTIISSINLKPLSQSDLNHLIADALRCQELLAVPLTQMVFAKTKGNPFFTNQFLKSLHKDGIITFDFDVNYWRYDISQLQVLALTDDVVEFMALQIERLPNITQEVLKLAACIGNEFDLKTLAIVHEKSAGDTATDLWTALHEGLIIPQTDVYKLFQDSHVSVGVIDSKNPEQLPFNSVSFPKYKFIHDRVQQAAYSLIPEDKRKPIHLKIGLLLLNNIPVAEREDKIFELVNQFNIAVEFITHQTKRDELAAMNLIAGRKALVSTAYLSAVKYLTTGIELLADNSWGKKYELTLDLYETAAEAAYLAGNFEQMDQFVEVVLEQAKTLLEKVKVCEVKIQAYGAQNKALEAVNTALAFLKLLGVEFPDNPAQYDVQLAMREIASNLNGRCIEDLIDLPEMIEGKSLAATLLLSSVSGLVYQAVPQLFPLIVFKQIKLSLTHGNTALSAFAYITYGLILCGVVGDIESGYQFGKLAINIMDKYDTKKVKAKIMQGFNAVIRHWKEHTREIVKPLLEAYHTGLETGDLEYAAFSLKGYSYSSYFIGKELTQLEREMVTNSNAITKIKQDRAFNWNSIFRQIVLNLLGNVENPCYLIGESYNEDKMLAIHLQAKDGVGLLYLYFGKLHLCYLFQNFHEAIKNAAIVQNYIDCGIGQLFVPVLDFYDSLTRLAIYPNVDEYEQKEILKKVANNQEKMQHWAHHAPMNYLHKFYLVEAERHRVFSQYLEAIELYDRSISLAKENEYINEEALANELAARFYLEWGKPKIAQTYLTDAYYCYSRWGAKAKVEDLAKRYPQLLAPILKQEKLSLHPSEKSTYSHSKSLSSVSNQQTIIGSKTSISDSLDLASVIKASQALSGEIELEQLISTLMKVVMENAGASKGALILTKGNNLNLKLTAVSANSTTEFPAINLESSDDVPITLINYVKRTLEILVIDDAKADISLAEDSYIIRKQPKSLLCIPIINQNKMLGIIYLENNLTTGAFTRDRVELLKLLTTQVAISLENAILYKNLAEANENLEEYNHKLEDKVQERTHELNEKNQHLQQAIEELQRTQTQLIQSEKMSSLGQMVAGIAHEINNPINFIHGNVSHASEYVKDLLDLIDIYQQEYPQPSSLVEAKNEEIDIDFLLEDLPKLLDSMKMGSSRIRNIVLGLRNFSRLDESEMKPVDIHEGIDNTLMILQHKLNQQSHRPEIEVIKEYGQLPEISCYAGQLNQVFMNILSNAIDALEETFISGKKTDNLTIRLHTELVDNHTVKIQIADNGSGMTEAVRQKIFDPFFTTKPIGSGTGLGLSISYQVVVDKHKGKLTCDSALGEGTEFVIEIPMN